MEKDLKYYLFSQPILFRLFLPMAKVYYYFLLKKWMSPKEYLLERYEKWMKRSPNWENPERWSDKLYWLKLYHTKPEFGMYADKFRVRDFIAEKWGEEHLIPLLYETDEPDNIRPENLPDIPFIIKTNHDSSGGIIVRDKYDKEHNWTAIRNTLRFNMAFNYYWNGREAQYRDIKPHIIVEKLLLDEQGNIPMDYKLHFFNGKLAITQVIRRKGEDFTITFYTKEWEKVPCKMVFEQDIFTPEPKNFKKMIALGEKVAKGFPNLRVDFYDVGGKLYFGELTFHIGGGNIRFEPDAYDFEFGKMLELPKKENLQPV
ncbi:MAG: glycosyl transferase [Flavobacteriaceae bacterium]|nr:glycosyl transferase [Flavobacteriaceae bacterium]